MNPNIGTIKCPFTGGQAFVRKGAGRFPLYIVCDLSPQLFMKTQAGQDYILNNMKALAPEERAKAEGDRPGQRTPEPVKAPAPVHETVEEKPKGAAWDTVI
jgi:hypothetical protein